MHLSRTPRFKKLGLFFLPIGVMCLVVLGLRSMIVGTLHKAVENHVDLANLETAPVENKNARQVDTTRRTRLAASVGEIDTISHRLKQGLNIDQDLGERTTMLMLAAQHNQNKTVQFLMEHNAQIAAQDVDGKDALIFAAEAGNVEEVLSMLDHDKQLSVDRIYKVKWETRGTNQLYLVRPKFETTLLHIAVEHGRLPLVRALLDLRANTDARDGYNSTALTNAVAAGNTDMVRLLIDHHADVNASMDASHSPLAYARRNHHSEIAHILEQAGATR